MRILILKLLADLQKTINNNEESHEYLVEHPFPVDRITIMISLYDGKKAPPPDIFSFAFSDRNHITYRTSDPTKSIFNERRLKESLREAFERANIDIKTISPIDSRYDDQGRLLKTSLQQQRANGSKIM